MKENNVKKNLLRSLKYGSVSVAFLAVGLAVLVVVNILVSMFDMKIDLTEASLFSISNTTKKVFEQIGEDKKVEIYGLYDPAIYASEKEYVTLTELVRDYQAQSNGKITVSFIDPVKDPAFFARIGLKDAGDRVRGARFLVKYGERIELVQYNECYIDKTTRLC